jgi:hypothetical protein
VGGARPSQKFISGVLAPVSFDLGFRINVSKDEFGNVDFRLFTAKGFEHRNYGFDG